MLRESVSVSTKVRFGPFRSVSVNRDTAVGKCVFLALKHFGLCSFQPGSFKPSLVGGIGLIIFTHRKNEYMR